MRALYTAPGYADVSQVLRIAMNLAVLWALRRFGFLSVLVAWMLWEACVSAPISLTSWYASPSLMLPAIPVVISAWAYWVILTAQQRSIPYKRSLPAILNRCGLGGGALFSLCSSRSSSCWLGPQ
jgi:hypothetical protein